MYSRNDLLSLSYDEMTELLLHKIVSFNYKGQNVKGKVTNIYATKYSNIVHSKHLPCMFDINIYGLIKRINIINIDRLDILTNFD